MAMPFDPNQPQQGQQPPPPPQPQIVYVQAPAPTGKQTSRTKVGGSAHSMHLILTVCTCGMWLPVWFLHWLFGRKKIVQR